MRVNASSVATRQESIHHFADWVWEMDARGVCTYSSANVEELFGYTPSEVVGQEIFRLFQPERAREIQEAFSLCAAAPEEGRRDLVHGWRRKDGGLVWLLVRGVPLLDDGGECTGYCGIAKDITVLKTAEAELDRRKTEVESLSREYRIILDGIPDILTVFDSRFHLLWANRAALDRAGRTIEEAIGQTCQEFWCHRRVRCEACVVAASMHSGTLEEALSSCGGVTWGKKAFPIKNDAGEVIRVIELGSDITEKLHLRHEAQRASRLASLGELAAGVAHEINNPNAMILANAPILQEACSDLLVALDELHGQQGDFPVGRLGYRRMRQELPRLIEEIGSSAKRIRRIVDDLKDFVRQDGHDFTEPLDFNAVVQAAVRLVGNVIKQSTGHFSTEYAAHLPPLQGRAQEVEQVVVNLIVNACQALPATDRAVHVATAHDPLRRQVVCTIRDEGIGIRPENLLHLTDPFFTTRREQGGTGLGLSVSSRIVKEHGGRLNFDSAPGAGTTVTLMLPVPAAGETP